MNQLIQQVFFEKVFANEGTTKADKFMIPVVGSAVAAAMYGTSTYGLLKTTLNSSRTLAEKCLEVLKNYFCTHDINIINLHVDSTYIFTPK